MGVDPIVVEALRLEGYDNTFNPVNLYDGVVEALRLEGYDNMAIKPTKNQKLWKPVVRMGMTTY